VVDTHKHNLAVLCSVATIAVRCGSSYPLIPPGFPSTSPLPPLVCCCQDDVAGCFDYYAGLAEQLDSRQYSPIDVGMDEFRVAVRREPLGVVALITPWN
jgi:hypothetical protein